MPVISAKYPGLEIVTARAKKFYNTIVKNNEYNLLNTFIECSLLVTFAGFKIKPKLLLGEYKLFTFLIKASVYKTMKLFSVKLDAKVDIQL